MKLQELINLKEKCPVCQSELVIRLTDNTDQSDPIHLNANSLINKSILKLYHNKISIFVNLKDNIYVYRDQNNKNIHLKIEILCKKFLHNFYTTTLLLQKPDKEWLNFPNINLSL